MRGAGWGWCAEMLHWAAWEVVGSLSLEAFQKHGGVALRDVGSEVSWGWNWGSQGSALTIL